jgi:hypothetical protein
LLGGAVAPRVGAEKNTGNKPPSVAYRVHTQPELCEVMGKGKLAVHEHDHGTATTECKGGENDGWTCFDSATQTKFHQPAAMSPVGPLHPLEPVGPWSSINGSTPVAPITSEPNESKRKRHRGGAPEKEAGGAVVARE